MTPSARMPLIRRRRWYPSKTVYSAAQAEMELIGGGTTQLEMDLGDPVPSGAQRPPAPTEIQQQGRISSSSIQAMGSVV